MPSDELASPTIRPETSADLSAIRSLTERAFRAAEHTSHTEHFIVDALRNADALSVSLVAEIDGQLVGHIAFSPITCTDGSLQWFGLGPISVHPDYQRKGIGTALVVAGLAALCELDAHGCVVLGEPTFYRRFGFRYDPHCVLEGVPPEYFQMLSIGEQKLRGVVSYHAALGATA